MTGVQTCALPICLLVLPQEERVAREYQIDRRYGWLLIVMGVFTTLFLLLNWALPYNGLI